MTLPSAKFICIGSVDAPRTERITGPALKEIEDIRSQVKEKVPFQTYPPVTLGSVGFAHLGRPVF